MRTLAVAPLLFGLLAVSAAPAVAQPGVYTRAAPPEKAALDRLDLVADWAAYLPVAGRADGLTRVQAVDATQVFVQTKGGVLIALDAKTGREQWKYKFPSSFTDGYPVAVNARYVFSVNVSKLICHQRYTGALEFEANLPQTPAAGPVTDGDQVYVAFTGAKVVCYELPASFRTTARGLREAKERGAAATPHSLADEVAARAGGRTFGAVRRDQEIEQYIVPKAYREGAVGGTSRLATESVAVLQSVVPPYTLGGLNKVESIGMLPSVKKPYTLKPEYLTHNQLTPSIAAIPPSIARVYELSNLRPPPFEPKVRWLTATVGKVYRQPLYVPDTPQAPGRLWVVEDGKVLEAIARDRGTGDQPQRIELPAEAAAGIAGPFGYDKAGYPYLGVLPLADGQVIGLDLGGAIGNTRFEWRANVGGVLNRPVVAAADGVYVGGDHVGVARIDVRTGEVDWRTGAAVDRVAAVSDEHLFARDRRGDLYVYAKGRVNDPATRLARPLGVLPAADFGVGVTNAATDRVLLAADNGLVVCLRDAGPKTAKPKVMAPPPPAAAEPPKPTDPNAPPADSTRPPDPSVPPVQPKPLGGKLDPPPPPPDPSKPLPVEPRKDDPKK